MKKIYSLLLVLLMAVMGVNTAKAMEIMDSGDGWRVEKDYDYEHYYLIITNKNAMKNYSSASAVPWHDWRPYIWSISFDRTSFTGTRNVGAYCFCDMPLLSSASIADTYEDINDVTIGAHAFENCPNLQGLSGDRFIKSIGDYAFKGCTSTNFWAFDGATNATKIGAHAFEGCTNLSMCFHNGTANTCTIGESAFRGCTSLCNIDLKNVKTIEKEAFYGCVNLRYAILNRCEAIKERTFYGCTLLSDVTLTNCQTIGQEAFFRCSIKTLTIGSAIYSISDFAFSNGIENKAHIYMNTYSPPTASSDAFYYVNCSTISLHVPEGCESAYSSTYPWSQFRINPDPYTIYGVYNGTKLTIYYDDQMDARGGIEEWWWETNRKDVTSAVLDASVDDARPTNTKRWFYGFEKLTSITNLNYLHTDKVTDMYGMFSECKALTSIDLSHFNTSNVTNFSDMFSWCESLTEIDVNPLDLSSATNTYFMFGLCTNLEKIYCDKDWSQYSIALSGSMFDRCTSLRGGKGTEYNSSKIGLNYARPDGGTDAPGYFWKAGDDGLNHEGIDNVQTDKVQGTKVIRDGQLFIERNGKTYNAQGAEVR